MLAFRERGYKSALPADKYTNITMRNPEGTRCYDNVWIAAHTAKVYTGNVTEHDEKCYQNSVEWLRH